MQLYLIVASAFIVTSGLILVLRRCAPTLGLVAGRSVPLPDSATVVTAGGLAIMAGIVSVFVLLLVSGGSGAPVPSGTLLALLCGTLALAVLGLWDDISPLRPTRKLFVQAVVAGAAFLGGVQVTSVGMPLVGTVDLVPALAFAVTVFWLILVTNAFNLADGADGVAAGVALLAACALLSISITAGRDDISLVLLAALLALSAFLLFNFPPASVIMGDTGSLSIGFLLGGLVVVGGPPSEGGPGLAAAALIFAFPLVDTGLAVVRRFLSNSRITRADRGHIHDRLRDLGFSPAQISIMVYAGSAMLGAVGILLTRSSSLVLSALLLLVAALSVVFALGLLRIPELAEAVRFVRGVRHGRQAIGRSAAVTRQAECLRNASELDEIQRQLESIFSLVDFDQVELWVVTTSWLGPDSPLGGATWEPDGPGVRWRWHRLGIPLLPLERCWELKLPILDGERRQVGRLTFRRSLRAGRSVQIGVLADAVAPALGQALERVAAIPITVLGSQKRERWAG